MVILGLIAVSFIFWGIDFNVTGPSFAAKVNGEEISLAEFDRNLQAEQNRFQELYRVELDETIRNQLRRNVLERLVSQEALSQRVDDAGYRASDQRVVDSIRSISVFQVGGEFSQDAYESQLAFQGMAPAQFEALQREQLELLDLQLGIAGSSFLTPAEFRRYIELVNQRRQIGYALFEVDSFIDQIEISDEQVAAHYEENRDQYMTEEAVALEYVQLRKSDIADQIEVTDAALESYYEQHADQFRTNEERRASHILITPEEGESDDDARARAEAVLERIRSGEDFAAVAAEVSDDVGTAQNGGDLGWITRGMLAGPFEDALFAMEAGEIEGPVKTDFGYHIIRLDEIRAAEEQPFEEVRDELAEQYRTEQAEDLYYDRANMLADLAFDSYDNLASVAMELGLPLETVERFPRSGDPEVFPNSAPVVDVVFGAEALEVGVNSELIELSDDAVVVVRVTEQLPPEQEPLEAVADEIRETLTRARAEELASDAAEAFAAALPEELTREFVGLPPEPAADAASSDDGAAAEGEGQAAEGEDQAAAEAPGEEGAAAEAAENAPAADLEEEAADAEGDGEAAAEESPVTEDSPAARLAAEHGGTWVAPAWRERSDASVPTEILGRAFDLPEPAPGMLVREPVELASGDQALLVLSGVQPGDPDTVADAQRTSVRQQMLDGIGSGELGAYVSSVRQQADVTIPPEVLEPQF